MSQLTLRYHGRNLRRGAVFGLMLCLVTLLVCGCNGGNGTEGRETVTGDVTLDGVPLDSGSINFEPQGSEGTASGAVITAGKFEIPADQGLAPGSYRVFITAPEGGPDNRSADEIMNNPGPPAKERVPAKYNAQSELTAEIKAGGPNQLSFPLTTK